MIQIFVRSQGDEHLLEMTGHAEHNPGNDVVCAGASAIAYTLLGYLHNAGEHLEELGNVRVESGDLLVRCRGDEFVAETYKMALIGFLQLAERYPEYVSVRSECEGF